MKCKAIAKSTGRQCSNTAGEDGYCHVESHRPEAEKQLTMKQRRFVEEYTVDFNATQAAIRAGYSEDTAGQIGHSNLKKVEIADAIAARVDSLCMKADEALIRLAEMARADLSKYVDVIDYGEGVQIVKYDMDKIREDGMGHLIKSAANSKGQAKLEFHDSKDAIDKILKAHGTFGAKGTKDDPIYNVDFGNLTNEQLSRLAAGESPADVLSA